MNSALRFGQSYPDSKMNIQCLYELIWKRTVDLRAKTNDRERQDQIWPLIWHCISVNCHTSRWILCLNTLLLLLTRCICPTIQLYLWEGRHTSHCICISRWCLSHIKMETKLEQIILLSEESFVFGIWVQEFDYLWGVICICDRLDLSALSVFASQPWFVTNQDVK